MKRKPGGQPGNKNAEKHGYYGQGMTKALKSVYLRMLGVGEKELRGEIALLRTSIDRLSNIEKGNLDTLATMMRTLVRVMCAHHGFNPQLEASINQSMRLLLNDLLDREEATV